MRTRTGTAAGPPALLLRRRVRAPLILPCSGHAPRGIADHDHGRAGQCRVADGLAQAPGVVTTWR